jgi:hypothetical protein
MPCSAWALLVWIVLAACSERAAPAPEPTPSAPAAPSAVPAPPVPAEPSAQPPAQPSQPAPSSEPAREGAAPAKTAEPERAERTAAPAPAAVACGDEGQPSCPLQGWMERNVQKRLDDGDFARLAQALARVPRFVPDPSWNDGEQGWSKLAEAAAVAARATDGDAVEQSCKACHRTWRKKYKQEFRLRPVSD